MTEEQVRLFEAAERAREYRDAVGMRNAAGLTYGERAALHDQYLCAVEDWNEKYEAYLASRFAAGSGSAPPLTP